MARKDPMTEMRRWWVAELKRIEARVTAQEQKRQERIIKQNQKKMGEYEGWTYRDFQDAYGCGEITERQFDKFTRLLEGQKPEPSELYIAKIELLQEMRSEQTEILIQEELFEQTEQNRPGKEGTAWDGV